MRWRKDLVYLFILMVLALIFWAPALMPGKVFFLRDLALEIIPKRYFFAHSAGARLWCPYLFFGTPFAANPQSEAFYPFNFFFILFGAGRGLVYYIIFHHIFFLLTFFLALRRMGFGEETSLVGAVGFGFGGFVVSLTLLPVLLSTAAWFPLLTICLAGAAERGWLKWSLLAGLAVALQVLAGEIEIAAMSWVLALASTVASPGARGRAASLVKSAGSLAFGLAFGALLALPQISLAMQMIPFSNRAAGISFDKSLEWSLAPSALKSLVLPNYILPLSSGKYWGLGFFSGFPYFLSLYLGASILAFMLFSFLGAHKWKSLFWLVIALFGLAMICGDSLPVYTLIFKRVPGMQFFRIPVKFNFFLNFGVIMLALFGLDFFSSWQRSHKLVSAALMADSAVILILLALSPVRVDQFGNKYDEIARYLLMRTALRTSAFCMIPLGLVLWAGSSRATMVKLCLALVVFLDMFMANHGLNAAVGKEFYEPSALVKKFQDEHKGEIAPVRIFSIGLSAEGRAMKKVMDPLAFYAKLIDSMRLYWAVYLGMDNVRMPSSFCPEDVQTFRNLLEGSGPEKLELILARSGIKYLYSPDSGFEELGGAFARAMVFYQARAVPGQDEVIRAWSQPDFPAGKVVLLEGATEIGAAQEPLMSEPAKITGYESESVKVEAEARADGWLVLLDNYYPGWEAQIDGKHAEIRRADGFFRAVKIPAGRHTVTFDYHPDNFYRSLRAAETGLGAWILLLIVSFRRRTRKR